MLKLLCALGALTIALGSPAKAARPRAPEHRVARERSVAQARAKYEQRIFRQVLIRLASKASEPALRKALANDAFIIGRQGLLFLVRFHEPVTDQLLKELAQLPFVAHVERDVPSYPRQDVQDVQNIDDQSACLLPSAEWLPLSLPAGLAQVAKSTPAPCRLNEVCSGNERVKLWAQERVQADAMAREFSVQQLKPSHTKVAVIDTGFDMTANKSLLANPDFEVKKGYDGAGEPGKDEGGHGTMVIGVIGGKDGLGIAPKAKVTSYRITEARYTGGGVSGATLKMAIQRACDDGNEVINLSWGGLSDESGAIRDEVADKAFYDGLAQKGCLVVKAAGNDGYRKEYASDDLDDAYLRVAAIAPHGALAQFSSRGEVAAPGAGVFTLESHDVYSEDRAKDANLCGQAPGRFVSGTSFAAPITAAIAAQVIGVLKQSSVYALLSGPARIRLVNRILSASHFGGTVNALRAAVIANRWGQVMEGLVPTRSTDSVTKNVAATLKNSFEMHEAGVADLKKLLSLLPHESCINSKETCASMNDCEKQKECVRNKRVAIALCTPISIPAVRDLLETQIASADLENSVATLRVLRELGPGANDSEFAAYDASLWNAFRARWEGTSDRDLNLKYSLDFDVATEVLPAYLDSRADDDAGRAQGALALDQFVQSYQARDRILTYDEKGGKEDMARVVGVLAAAQRKLGAAQLAKALSFFIGDNTTSVTTSGAKLLNALINDAEFAGARDELLSLEKKLYLQLVSYDPPVSPTKALGYAGLFERNFEASKEKFEKGLASRDASALGGIEILFLLAKDSQLTQDRREDLALLVLDSIGRGAGWSSLDLNLVELSIATLRASPNAAKHGPVLHKLLESTNNFELLAGIFPRANDDRKLSEYDLTKLKGEVLFPAEFLFAMARKTALMYQAQSERALEVNFLALNRAMSATVPYLVSDPNASAGATQSLAVSLPFEAETDRLHPPGAIASKMTKAQSKAEMLDGVLARAFDDLRVASQTEGKGGVNINRKRYGYELIAKITDNPDALKLLPKDGAWKEAYKRLRDDAKASDRYSQRMLDELDKNLGSLAGL